MLANIRLEKAMFRICKTKNAAGVQPSQRPQTYKTPTTTTTTTTATTTNNPESKQHDC